MEWEDIYIDSDYVSESGESFDFDYYDSLPELQAEIDEATLWEI